MVTLKTKVLASKIRKQLRLAMWNVSGLCSECKQKAIADLLACNSSSGTRVMGKGGFIKYG